MFSFIYWSGAFHGSYSETKRILKTRETHFSESSSPNALQMFFKTLQKFLLLDVIFIRNHHESTNKSFISY